jgi:hypothetical protein
MKEISFPKFKVGNVIQRPNGVPMIITGQNKTEPYELFVKYVGSGKERGVCLRNPRWNKCFLVSDKL